MENITKVVSETLDECRVFKDFHYDFASQENADYKLFIEYNMEEKMLATIFLGLLSRLSMGVIPGSTEMDYNLKLSLVRNRTPESLSCGNRATDAVWWGIWFLPLYKMDSKELFHAETLRRQLRFALKNLVDEGRIPSESVGGGWSPPPQRQQGVSQPRNVTPKVPAARDVADDGLSPHDDGLLPLN
ncbi:MAG: hypothetical protein LBG65_07530 [Puniceicoccales bacterium]|nr:hypothetical protein [Puniceicoccales bacterium]